MLLMLAGNVPLTAYFMGSKFDLTNPRTLHHIQPTKALQTISQDWFLLAGSHRFKVKTIKQAVEREDVPSLATFKKYQGHEKTFTVLAQLVLFTLKMINVKSTANDFQVVGICEMILDDYYFLKLSEVRYCFNRGLSGAYKKEGKLFGKIDITDFGNWLSLYSEERSQFMTKKQTSKVNEVKNTAKSGFSKDVVAKIKSGLKSTPLLVFNSVEAKRKALELKIEQLESNIVDYKKVLEAGEFKGNYQTIDRDGNDYEYNFEETMLQSIKSSEIKLNHLKDLLK